MTSSEDVLLQVGQVRFKKGDGTLYVMNERLAWMIDHRDTVSVSHRYADIKMQKISPEGKPKIQLQVVLHDGSASTFQFVNKAGVEVQMKERDDVKQLLQQLLVKFKVEVNKELEEKNRMLSENPAMLQLYRDLVTTQVISSEEFWAHHTSQFKKPVSASSRQDIGVTGAFLADIKPQTDGCNGLKYNLTTDIIECIFKTYPAVRKKHLEQVPHKSTEADFWTKFFQSHYFHRDRVHTGNKDIFTECAKLDDIEIDRAIKRGVDDVLVDLAMFDDKTLDEGYGTTVDRPSRHGNAVHQSMIKRFNQHSIMVMNAGSGGILSSHPTGSAKVNAEASKDENGVCDAVSEEPHTFKKRRIQEKISLSDLREDAAGVAPVRLKLMQVDRYLQGPLHDSGAAADPNASGSGAELSRREELDAWRTRHGVRGLLCVSPAAAVGALGELTPGGALMRGFREDSIAHMLNKETQNELKNLYLSSSELLRHFWSCFPPASAQQEEKALAMHEALNRFHSARLKPFEDRLSREFSPLSQQLTSHLNQMLTYAYRKFVTWQQRQSITR